jgi:protein TonB
MVQVLSLMAALMLVLIVLLFQIAQMVPWPAWMLPEMEMPDASARVFSAAKAKGDPAGWILADDYPAAAIRGNMQGKVAIRFAIDEHGRVRRCDTVRSSGHAILDDAACAAILRRGSFEPARDAAGNPVAVSMERNVVWRLPDE